jgi:hypothetical protein
VVEVSSSGYLDNAQHQLRYDDGAYVLPGDFNGDGMCDFLRQEHGDWASNSNHNFSLYISNGDGSFESSQVSTMGHFTNPDVELSGDLCELKLIDFNGDGHCDFMRRGSGKNENGIDNAAIYFTAYGN